MGSPLVSVTIPCFNGEQYVARALECALGQTLADIEVLVLDDGSTDGTADVVAGFRDPRLRYVRREHLGLAAARNQLVDLSRGTYLAFLDADDIWAADKLARQVEHFGDRPAVGIVYSDCHVLDSEERILGCWSDRFPLHRGDVFERLIAMNFVPLPTAVVRRSVLAEAGSFRPYQVCADYDMFLRCATRWHFDYVDAPLAGYRTHPNQLSRRYDTELRECLEIFHGWEAAALPASGRRALRKAVARAYMNAGKSAMYEAGDGRRARDLLRQAQAAHLGLGPVLFYPLTFLGRDAVMMLRRTLVQLTGTFSLSR